MDRRSRLVTGLVVVVVLLTACQPETTPVAKPTAAPIVAPTSTRAPAPGTTRPPTEVPVITATSAVTPMPTATAPPSPTTTPVPPVNDNRDNAQPIDGPFGTVSGDSSAASREPWESVEASQSVWYRWPAPGPGTVTLDTIGSDFDTFLEVWSVGNDGQWVRSYYDDNSAANGASRLQFMTIAGGAYAIGVAGIHGASGDFTLHWNWLIAAAPAELPPSSAASDEGVVADVSQQFSTSGGQLTGCDTLFAGESTVLHDWPSYIPARLDVCLEGFQAGTITVQMIRPDGMARPANPQTVTLMPDGKLSVMVPLNDPPGSYTIIVTQGAVTGRGTVDLAQAIAPTIEIFPAAAPGGSVFTVYLTGLPPNEHILLDAYKRGDCPRQPSTGGLTTGNPGGWCYVYRRSFSVNTDGNGQSVASLTVDDLEDQYVLAIHNGGSETRFHLNRLATCELAYAQDLKVCAYVPPP